MAYMTNERYIVTDAIYEYYKWFENQGFKVLIPEEVENTPCVFMAMDLFDEKLIEEYSEVYCRMSGTTFRRLLQNNYIFPKSLTSAP